MSEHYSLRQLNMMVREAIEMELPDEYWVEAELSECRENGGHCYMELIEKDEHSNTTIARAAAKCWRQTWLMVKPYFERTTGQPLRTDSPGLSATSTPPTPLVTWPASVRKLSDN